MSGPVQLPPSPPAPTAEGDERAIQRAAELLLGARRPVIWAGGGAVRAQAGTLVGELAEYLQIPVVTTRQGKGSISERHPLSLGMANVQFGPLGKWLAGRDVILAVGTSQLTGAGGQQVIRIDVDESELSPGRQLAQHPGRRLSCDDGAQPGCGRVLGITCERIGRGAGRSRGAQRGALRPVQSSCSRSGA